MITIAIDIGGTFTDLMGFDDRKGTFVEAKSLSTPSDLVQGIIDCLRKSGVDCAAAGELIHGSTQAINTLIERTGAKTGLIVTEGTRDVYIIGRGNRPESYNLLFRRHRPLVTRRLTREVPERMLSSGEVLKPLKQEDVKQVCDFLASEGVDAVAVCLLHSYVNPDHEKMLGDAIRKAMPNAYVSLSHEIMREYREFERMSTTVVNAYIGPKIGGYVRRLSSRLKDVGFKGNLRIMRSNGGVMTADIATDRPVAMMESGPVGGIIASARVASALGYPNAIAFDMGGTTTKASLIQNGEPARAGGYYIGGYASGHPVMEPVVDVVEVGAGGGSIAWIDEVGALKVGPQSAGADPGPICYQNGGTEPTITDANVVLGRLNPKDFLGGKMDLDADGARKGVKERVADKLGLDVIKASQAILDIAIMKMSLAVREVSVAKGFDPRDFVLVASGGAGPLHVLPIARELHVPTVIIPLFPSQFSALGMLMADERHDFIRTYYGELSSVDFPKLLAVYQEMVGEARVALQQTQDVQYEIKLDIRYLGQEFTMQVPVTLEQLKAGDWKGIRACFDQLYEQRYAHHSPGEPVEMVNIRLAVTGKRAKLNFPRLAPPAGDVPYTCREVYLTGSEPVNAPVYRREALRAGFKFTGPAIVQEDGTTTVLFQGDTCTVMETGELIIQVGE